MTLSTTVHCVMEDWLLPQTPSRCRPVTMAPAQLRQTSTGRGTISDDWIRHMSHGALEGFPPV